MKNWYRMQNTGEDIPLHDASLWRTVQTRLKPCNKQKKGIPGYRSLKRVPSPHGSIIFTCPIVLFCGMTHFQTPKPQILAYISQYHHYIPIESPYSSIFSIRSAWYSQINIWRCPKMGILPNHPKLDHFIVLKPMVLGYSSIPISVMVPYCDAFFKHDSVTWHWGWPLLRTCFPDPFFSGAKRQCHQKNIT